MNYQDILGAVVLTSLAALLVAFVLAVLVWLVSEVVGWFR